MKNNIYNNIDEYINMFDGIIKERLILIRQEIKNTVPNIKETISYGMPAFKLKEVLVYFAAYKDYIGFYPTPGAIEEFKNQLNQYNTSKGAIHLP